MSNNKIPFIPDKLPLKNIDWIRFIKLIGKANYELACFEGILKGIVNPNNLLTPLTTKEAVLSSKIEGTQATLQEVLEYEANPRNNIPKKDDIIEIINYRKAINEAIEWLKEKPITLNLMKKLHFTLLNSVRGMNKARGEFRKDQNWIGKPGCEIEEATFIPPEPMNLMQHLDNWEKYIHYEEMDRIVQIAIIHAQFEIIHPFKDGNGRLGRLLIPLFLFEKQLLSNPVFYMSEYLENYRDEYYDGLNNISEHNDWNSWINFFLKALINQAQLNIQRATQIINLYENMKRIIHDINSSYGLPALDTLFVMPIFNSSEFIRFSGIPKASAGRLINNLLTKDILKMIKEGAGRTPNTYAFTELIFITENNKF